jgi:hypothetical protein
MFPDEAAIVNYLAGFGDEASIGGQAFPVDFAEPAPLVEYTDGYLDFDGPTALANPADVSRLGIEPGAVINVLGRAYRVLAIAPDEAGFVRLNLGDYNLGD